MDIIDMKLTFTGFAIATVSYITIATTDITPAIQALIALPGSAGLLMALWEIIMTQVKHQHRLEEKSVENTFVLSATSHMAKVAFDKHVEFCLGYVKCANNGLSILFRDGPTKETLNIAGELSAIRREYILWETRDVAVHLDKFETALRSIGADEHYLDNLHVGEERTEVVNRIYTTFKAILDIRKAPEMPTPEIAVSKIIECGSLKNSSSADL